jgi:transposase
VDESLLLSGEERDRLKVLHEVKKRHITQRQAAEQLKLSTRWVKKLLKRLRERGDRAVVHGLKGRPSNRKIAGETEQKATDLIRRHYRDYGPTQAAEVLASEHEIMVGHETVRKWMSAAKLWRPKRAKVTRVHGWRPRRERRGELVQWVAEQAPFRAWDTSEHDWLEGRGPKLYLIAMIDDATSELTARFALSDSTAENMRLLWRYLERPGRPVDFYTDKASLFTINRPLHYNKHLPEEPGKTQLGRALEELGIGWIAAHSPQAKGRIERCFGTLQDRLVKALRRAGAASLEEANQFLEDVYLPEWNRRFRREPASCTDAHRSVRKDQNPTSILSFVEDRVVANDYTISWLGQHYQIPLEQTKPRLRKAKLRVEQRLTGELVACWQGRQIALTPCVRKAKAVAAMPAADLPPPRRKAEPNGRWMKSFWVGDPAKRLPPKNTAPGSPTGSTP